MQGNVIALYHFIILPIAIFSIIAWIWVLTDCLFCSGNITKIWKSLKDVGTGMINWAINIVKAFSWCLFEKLVSMCLFRGYLYTSFYIITCLSFCQNCNKSVIKYAGRLSQQFLFCPIRQHMRVFCGHIILQWNLFTTVLIRILSLLFNKCIHFAQRTDSVMA